MSRLPIPNSDNGTWGNILNDFLSVAHNPDGTLKNSNGLADASSSAKGVIRLAGDLSGTAATPTVPGKLDKSTLTTKGDMYVASGAGLVSRLGVGTDNQTVVSDSTQANGIKWAGVPDVSEVINVKTHGVIGDAVNDETAKIQSVIALSVWPYPKRIYFPTGDYKISGTLSVPTSSIVMGINWQGSRFYPANGMTVPVFDLGINGGVGLKDVAIWQGGSPGTPAVVTGGQQQKVSGLDIRGWKGDGLVVATQNYSTIRNVNVTSSGGNGIVVSSTYTLLEGITSSQNTGHGFVLNNSAYSNGSGMLVGCDSEGNNGHGFYITGGQWDLQVYGEGNTGDLIHVDGTKQFDTQVTLSAAATAGDNSITVQALTKGLPEKGILRFSDGTAVVINADGSGPTVALKSAISTSQPNGSVASLAPEDIPSAKLPTVRIRPGTLDGTIYLNACNYAFESGFMPVGGSVTATQSARMIGEAQVLTNKGNARVWGGGGSNSTATVLGGTAPIMSVGLAHVANPNSDYLLQHSYANAYYQDISVPGGFYLSLLAQYNWAQTATGWQASSLSLGDYTVRALVRNVAQTTSGIAFSVAGGPSQTFTTRTNGWEWINLDFTQTDATQKVVTGSIIVQRVGGTTVDVAAIVVVPRSHHQVTPGTWTDPAYIGSTSKFTEWVDISGNLRFSSALPTADTDSDFAITNNAIQIGNATKLISGTGTPQGVVTAPIGSLFSRTDGGTSTTLYVKEAGSGNTGWVTAGSGNGSGVLSGTGTPQGVVTAPIGSIYSRTDGSVGTAVYIKELGTGSSGWTALNGSNGTSAGTVSFKMWYLDIPNNYGSTTWFNQPISSNGSGIGGMPYFGGYNQSGNGTAVEELTYDVNLSAGTWSLEVYYVGGVNTGQFTVLLDGTESGVVDTYNGGYSSTMVMALTGVSVTAGVHTVTIRKKGTKNASSTDYYILWSGVMGLKTGP